jgi:hypothetical protein
VSIRHLRRRSAKFQRDKEKANIGLVKNLAQLVRLEERRGSLEGEERRPGTKLKACSGGEGKGAPEQSLIIHCTT